MSRVGRGRALLVVGVLGACAAVVLTVTATVMAILGGELGCLGGGTASAQPAGAAAQREIPPARLALYQAAGRRFDIDWAFVAAIGTQECGTGRCAQVYPSGCGGPMQIALVPESACSPGPGPTIWDRYKVDGDGDGKADPFNLADSIFTAARLMRVVMHAPPIGGTYAAYRQAACNYYGACADGIVDYADEVMRRAVSYGFGRGGGESGASLGGGCAASTGAGRPARPGAKGVRPAAPGGAARQCERLRGDQLRRADRPQRRLPRSPLRHPRQLLLCAERPRGDRRAPARRGDRRRPA